MLNQALRSRRFFRGNFCALLSGLGKANGDCLLAALHLPALAPFAGTERTFLLPPHRTLDPLARGLSILPPATALFFRCHNFLSNAPRRSEGATRIQLGPSMPNHGRLLPSIPVRSGAMGEAGFPRGRGHDNGDEDVCCGGNWYWCRFICTGIAMMVALLIFRLPGEDHCFLPTRILTTVAVPGTTPTGFCLSSGGERLLARFRLSAIAALMYGGSVPASCAWRDCNEFGDSTCTNNPAVKACGTESGSLFPYGLIALIPPGPLTLLHSDCSNMLSSCFNKSIHSSSAQTDANEYSVPLNAFNRATTSKTWRMIRGDFSLFKAAVASVACLNASAICALASDAMVLASSILASKESASCLAPVARVKALDAAAVALSDAATALLANVLARDAAFAAELEEDCVSTSTAWSNALRSVSVSLTKYSAMPSPTTPPATNVQPISPQIATHLGWRSFLAINSGQTRSHPLKFIFLIRTYQNDLTRATVLRPKPTASHTSGASQIMPIATAIVETTSTQNQKLDAASRVPRIILSKTALRLGSISGSRTDDGIDRNNFFISLLEAAGIAYLIVSVLCIWEFTIGIKESIKNLFER